MCNVDVPVVSRLRLVRQPSLDGLQDLEVNEMKSVSVQI
jgi:hypothetical protein